MPIRKIILCILVLTFVLCLCSWKQTTLTVMAHKNEIKFYKWVDDVTRNPEDPPYLTFYYRMRTTYFAVDPHQAHPIVFLGDSITDGGEWSKLFPNLPVENRGIGGDTTEGLLNRIDQIIALKPSQVFLMIGTNDLCFDCPIDEAMINYRHILTRLHNELPDTQIYIESVLPFNDTIFPSRSLRTNSNIRKLNIAIKNLAEQYNDPYIDLTPVFTDQDGRLFSKYTSDGLHLNAKGYSVWRDEIKKLVKTR